MLLLNGIHYLVEKEVSTQYGLSISWLRKARCTGKSPKYYKLNRKVYYTAESIEQWLKENLKSV